MTQVVLLSTVFYSRQSREPRPRLPRSAKRRSKFKQFGWLGPGVGPAGRHWTGPVEIQEKVGKSRKGRKMSPSSRQDLRRRRRTQRSRGCSLRRLRANGPRVSLSTARPRCMGAAIAGIVARPEYKYTLMSLRRRSCTAGTQRARPSSCAHRATAHTSDRKYPCHSATVGCYQLPLLLVHLLVAIVDVSSQSYTCTLAFIGINLPATFF
jgi:hypothetical protein